MRARVYLQARMPLIAADPGARLDRREYTYAVAYGDYGAY